MKDNDTVIQEFSELVNMTHQELEQWLKSDDSRSAGWPKEGADGESVGHDSGRNIVDILKSNPDASPDKYTEEHLQHMRKVVSYWSVCPSAHKHRLQLTRALQQATPRPGGKVARRKIA